jgi:hypothetical protein
MSVRGQAGWVRELASWSEPFLEARALAYDFPSQYANCANKTKQNI